VELVSRSPEAAEGKRVCDVRIYKGSEFTLEGLRPEGRSDAAPVRFCKALHWGYPIHC
jgi:hypothetical protein